MSGDGGGDGGVGGGTDVVAVVVGNGEDVGRVRKRKKWRRRKCWRGWRRGEVSVGVLVEEEHHNYDPEERKEDCRWSCVWRRKRKKRSLRRRRNMGRKRQVECSWNHLVDHPTHGPYCQLHLTERGCRRIM